MDALPNSFRFPVGFSFLPNPPDKSVHFLIVQPLATIFGVVTVSRFKLLQESYHTHNTKFARQRFHARDANLFERHHLCVHLSFHYTSILQQIPQPLEQPANTASMI
jgi:hypothetical protein